MHGVSGSVAAANNDDVKMAMRCEPRCRFGKPPSTCALCEVSSIDEQPASDIAAVRVVEGSCIVDPYGPRVFAATHEENCDHEHANTPLIEQHLLVARSGSDDRSRVLDFTRGWLAWGDFLGAIRSRNDLTSLDNRVVSAPES